MCRSSLITKICQPSCFLCFSSTTSGRDRIIVSFDVKILPGRGWDSCFVDSRNQVEDGTTIRRARSRSTSIVSSAPAREGDEDVEMEVEAQVEEDRRGHEERGASVIITVDGHRFCRTNLRRTQLLHLPLVKLNLRMKPTPSSLRSNWIDDDDNTKVTFSHICVGPT